MFVYGELERVIDAIGEALRQGEVQCRWVEPWGIQARACEQRYGTRADAEENDGGASETGRGGESYP